MTSRGEASAAAAERVNEVQARVRRAARWHGLMWLVLAAATPAFFLGVRAAPDRGFSLWVALAFKAIALGLWIADARRPVRGRTTARLDRPATRAYVVAVIVVVVVGLIVAPSGVPAWYVVITLLPAVPAAVAAAAILRT